jgi:hypothetical protein
MLKFLPNRIEVVIFAAAAVLCAAIVINIGIPDVGLSLLSIPVFISAALLGMFRSGHLTRKSQPSSRSQAA